MNLNHAPTLPVRTIVTQKRTSSLLRRFQNQVAWVGRAYSRAGNYASTAAREYTRPTAWDLLKLPLLALLLAIPAFAAADLTVDFSKTNGVLRPLHGVNLGPLCYRGMVDLSAYHRELNLPLTRLHDVVWVNYDAVDISTIFRDFRNDAAQVENYEFAATDDYIAAIVKAGSPILYRLGESIEHTPRKYRVHPPKDFAKWADICCAIIRHYNEGWAGGFRHNIRYWEIWNEPENQPAMWTGTDDQYFQLYEVTAKAIKARWPDLKVGGPSLGYTGEFKDGQFKAGEFLLRFLRHCRDHQVPLDFFSWHRYTSDPSDAARRARAMRQLLDEHGFTKTESHFNEWNYLPNEDWPGPDARTMECGGGRSQGRGLRGVDADVAAGRAGGHGELLHRRDPDVRHVQLQWCAAENFLCLQSVPRLARHAAPRADAAMRSWAGCHLRGLERREHAGGHALEQLQHGGWRD